MSDAKWTREKPTEPGFYWRRYTKGQERVIAIVPVCIGPMGTIHIIPASAPENLPMWATDERREWSGPIAPPGEG